MQIITAPGAAPILGPYSQAIKANGFIFASSQLAVNPAGEIKGDIAAQTRQALANVENILSGDGLDRNSIVKVVVYLTSFDDFDQFNTLYAEFFGQHRPARTTLEVARLPKGALIAVDATALCK